MVSKRPSDLAQERKNRTKELEKFRHTAEEARRMHNFYSAGVNITNAKENSNSVELEIDSSIDPIHIAAIAFKTGKTTIVNVKQDNQNIIMENNTAPIQEFNDDDLLIEEDSTTVETAQFTPLNSLEQSRMNSMESFEELEYSDEEVDTRSGLRKFWDFMNKPFYVRTWFGMKAPKA